MSSTDGKGPPFGSGFVGPPSSEREVFSPRIEAEDGGFGQTAQNYSPIPQMVGDYQVVARLGGGSMADLYLARKISAFGFIRRAVIKQVKRSRPDYKQLQRMLLDEARATACFDHPNLISLFDVGENENGLYLALEYVEGTDLRRVNQKLRARKEALPFELAVYTASEVLRGLHHAHIAVGADGHPLDIVHRDVNPSNVLVATSGHVKLADFGVVRMRERIQQKTEPGLVKGKYAYLAPEYIAGEPCSVQTDIYAAGIMLFELLSGRECFSGNTAYEVMWKIVNKGVPMYRLGREGVPEDLQRIVQRATSMVPERRYTTAQDMANALEAWLMRSGRHATPWVLSVFFNRHELFPRRLEEVPTPQALQRSVPAHIPKPVLGHPDFAAQRSAYQDELRDQGARAVDDHYTPTPLPEGLSEELSLLEPPPLLPPLGPEVMRAVQPTVPPVPLSVSPGVSPGAPASSQGSWEAAAPPRFPTDLGPPRRAPDSPTPRPALRGTHEGFEVSLSSAEDSLLAPEPPPLAASPVARSASDQGRKAPWKEPTPSRRPPPSQDRPAPEPGVNDPRGAAAIDDTPTPPAQPRRPSLEVEIAFPNDGEVATPRGGGEGSAWSAPPRREPTPVEGPAPRSVTRDPVEAPPRAAPRANGAPSFSLHSGKLEDAPAAEVLSRITESAKSGIVEFRCGLIWKRVMVVEGVPTGITSNMGMELIGEHLVKGRIISRDALDRALQSAERSGRPLTVTLLDTGVLDRPTLEEELGKNLAARLNEVLEWRWGTYEFTEQAMEPAAILPRLDLAGLLERARTARAQQDGSEDGEGEREASDEHTPQRRLKEALKVARSIAKSTGKGRVEHPWRSTKR